jgi:hypothetical protein
MGYKRQDRDKRELLSLLLQQYFFQILHFMINLLACGFHCHPNCVSNVPPLCRIQTQFLLWSHMETSGLFISSRKPGRTISSPAQMPAQTIANFSTFLEQNFEKQEESQDSSLSPDITVTNHTINDVFVNMCIIPHSEQSLSQNGSEAEELEKCNLCVCWPTHIEGRYIGADGRVLAI